MRLLCCSRSDVCFGLFPTIGLLLFHLLGITLLLLALLPRAGPLQILEPVPHLLDREPWEEQLLDLLPAAVLLEVCRGQLLVLSLGPAVVRLHLWSGLRSRGLAE